MHIFEEEAKNKALTFSYEIDTNLPRHLMGDPNRIQQVLINLISNAIKFTDEGSIHLVLNTLNQNGKSYTVDFSITDTGIGISKEDQLILFDQFMQIDNSFINKNCGTGLGLAISKELVEIMGGCIDVESELGNGSTFSFELSLGIAQEFSDLQNQQTEQNIIFENLKILIVEDNPYNREIMYTVLSNMEIEADEAENGKIAIDMIKNQPYDMVFMDIQMPIMDGLSAMRIIKQEGFTELPVVALSAYASKEEHQKSLHAGMFTHIDKPFKFSEIKQLLLEYFPKKLSNTTKIDNIKKSFWVNDMEQIQGITLDDEMYNYWKDENDFLTYLKSYISSLKEDAKHLRVIIDENNISQARKLMHKLKGSSKFYGAKKTFQIIEELEDNLDSTTPIDTTKILNDFDEAISEVNNHF